MRLRTAGLVIGGVVAVVSWLILRWTFCRRRTEVDWVTNRVELQIGDRSVSAFLEDVEGLVVSGKRYSGDDDSPPRFRCSVLMDLPGGREHLIQTWQSTDPDSVYRQAGSLADDLADHLDVDWKWTGFH